MNNIKSIVCTMANQMVKDGFTRSEAFKAAWAMAKRNESYDPAYAPVQETTAVNEQVVSQVREYREIQMLMAQLEEKAAAIKHSIVEVMEAAETDELIVDVFKVRYITVVSNRFNTSEFKKTHNDLYTQYLKENTYKRFTVA